MLFLFYSYSTLLKQYFKTSILFFWPVFSSKPLVFCFYSTKNCFSFRTSWKKAGFSAKKNETSFDLSFFVLVFLNYYTYNENRSQNIKILLIPLDKIKITPVFCMYFSKKCFAKRKYPTSCITEEEAFYEQQQIWHWRQALRTQPRRQ